MSSQEHITIQSKPSENKSENYNFLRQTGIDYLQKVVGKIWTDFNVHDPGVNVLEELCYAITDLGYRTNLDIKDLLAPNRDDPAEKDLNNFHSAREILTNAPFTITDYRKLLIDLEGVKNAWLEKTTDAEVDFYYNSIEKKITYEAETTNEKIELNGLYEVLLEFDYSLEFGDLNDNNLNIELPLEIEDLEGLVLDVTVEFPYWDYVWASGEGWDSLADIKSNIRNIEIVVDTGVEGFEISFEIDLEADPIDIQPTVLEYSGTEYVDRPDLANALKVEIDKLFSSVPAEGDENILVIQQDKVVATQAILERVKATVHTNRNLCEDFLRFSALKVEEIVLCADIQLTTEANSEEVLAEIYYLVGRFLAPNITFYSFAEMLENGKTTEEIFQGPKLENGFIDTDEVEASAIRKSIHVSDLINIIMDIEGVIAIKEIKIGNIPLGDSSITSKSVYWCLDLAWDKNFVPRLNQQKSKVVLIKKGIPFIADEEQVEQLVEEKIALESSASISIDELDLAIPEGTYYRLDEYTSIQNDFPENYGVGHVGLPDTASDKRKAQANQMKAYLLFFDQFLANYCSQLSSIKQLFSMNGDIEQTYFHQSLFDVPNVANLYKEYIRLGQFTSDPSKDSATEVAAAWNCFKELDENPLSTCPDPTIEPPIKSNRQALREIIEDKEAFEKRRNLFLDHLLARFAEDFSDYALLAYRLDGGDAGKELIEDKLDFLQAYPDLSYNRGQGFDYLSPGWNSDNVSGLEKRVALLLGIDNYDRRNLACLPPVDYFEKYTDDGGKLRFRLLGETGDILLKSEAYNSEAARTTGINSVLLNGVDFNNYSTLESAAEPSDFYYNLVAQNNEIIGTSNMYATPDERDLAIEKMILLLTEQCTGEGFYLVEHLLLRPRNFEQDDFMPVSFEDDCFCEGNQDAYSFRATCVMPQWIGRFRNMDFRNHVEKTIREETPAHIFMKICWVDQIQMEAFQIAYKEWLIVMENCPPDQTELTEKQNNLIAILSDLRNVYPVSTLYDCKESGDSPVVLNQSILGTFIPKEDE